MIEVLSKTYQFSMFAFLVSDSSRYPLFQANVQIDTISRALYFASCTHVFRFP